MAKFNETGSAERLDVYLVNGSPKLKPDRRVYEMKNNSRSLLDDPRKSITYRSLKRFEENNFLNDLAVLPWDSIERYANIDDALEAWYSLLVGTINKHAPIKTHRIKKNRLAQF